ncbi:hypothetical protein BJ166DRAFT_582910 [Pestalotiopsis sp. NC0098]|nr:hypothetical protein BJ166DRAFT_582910 [Pestalotiopsis sp. NC0098]
MKAGMSVSCVVCLQSAVLQRFLGAWGQSETIAALGRYSRRFMIGDHARLCHFRPVVASRMERASAYHGPMDGCTRGRVQMMDFRPVERDYCLPSQHSWDDNVVPNRFVIRRGWDKGPSLEPPVAPSLRVEESRARRPWAASMQSSAVLKIQVVGWTCRKQ